MTVTRTAVKTVVAAMVLAAGMAAPVAAQSVEQQLADLRAQVADITGDGSKGFRISPNTRLKVYGYVKADFIYDDNYDLGTTIFDIVSVNPGDPEETNFRTQAIQSRFGFWTYTDTAMGELQTRVEGDFFGNGGGGFRLRHAYGEVGPWLLGRTWTNFMPIESYPDSLDFQGPAGIPFARTEQIRYTHDFGNGLGGSASIESNPGGGTTSSPALTAAATYSFGSSFVKVAGVYRQIDPGVGPEEDSWGVNVSGNTSLWQGGTLSGTYTYGKGIGSYMVFGPLDDDIIAGDTIETNAFLVGLNQELTDKVSIGLIYGNRDDEGAASGTTEVETIHATIYYKPVPKMQLGLEYIYAERTRSLNAGGGKVDNSRIQASAQFNF